MNVKRIAASLLILSGMTTVSFDLEKTSQLNNINSKSGVNEEMVIGAMIISEDHRQNVENALVTLFENDGYVDIDNLKLYNAIVNKHMIDLIEKGNRLELSEGLSNNEKIAIINDSLKNN